ncbi:SPL family radical SAM protein [Clostridium algidicarnis]|uniref:SPL family radical SAM protein n=1 Tax=Clostridium algidicarnis TaxID=37659 RepID=UPI001C0CBB20|nr:radical SAM protein [Clostridium algidicarnis]MBU3192443.1 radical SAM protein [Clostridium algidicarnis]MBU3206463.1 radical SAM protein [Clostridium algidicarnis]
MHEVEVKGILSAKNGMNIYRGCTHGCIYCDSRSRCYQINHDFEDIEVKTNAPKLLEDALRRKRKKCMVATGAMCDPYIHLEESLRNTRKCIEIINTYGFGVSIQTKSARILKDLDLLKDINGKTKCVVQMTLTTYDEDLCRIIEPNVSTTKERFEVLKVMRDNGIPTVVWMSPILPFINDTEENIRGILKYCVEAKVHGIICFGMGVTMRDGNREYFYKKLDEHFPGMKDRYIKTYGYAYELTSDNNKKLMKILRDACEDNDILFGVDQCFEYIHKFEDKKGYEQLVIPGL